MIRLNKKSYSSALNSFYTACKENNYVEQRGFFNPVNTLKLLPTALDLPVFDGSKNLAFDKAVINLATPSSIQFPHTHGDSTVITYYINPEWKKEYYGETIFYNDSMTHCVGTALYEPNSAVVFDGQIPHSIRPASHVAPSYRFSLSIFFRKRNFLEEAKNNT